MIIIDVKHFFMSGTTDQMVSSSTEGLPVGALKSLLQDAGFFLLYHQYIRARFANNRVWRVKQGSGMGLGHSGVLADLSMYNLCENSLGTVH